MLDGLQEILFTLRQNKLRTSLTAFGVFWGVFMLILLLGFGRGMQNGAMDNFGSDVLDFILVYAGDTSLPYQGMGVGRRIQLDERDIRAIAHQIRGIRLISAERSLGSGTITYAGRNSNADIRGIPDEYFRIREDVPFNFGRRVDSLDVNEIRKITVIGTTVADRLFPDGSDPVGKNIRVKDVVMKVVGVFHDKSNQGRNSERVFIPLTSYRTIFGGGDRVDAIWLRPEPGTDGLELERQVLAVTKRRHGVAPDDKRGVDSFNMAVPAKNVNGLFIAINVFIWFVGLGTLTAGVVGISNIMIITVKERTREIGIRKALGATPFGIVSTLLLESTLVTGVAGYVGLVLAVALLELISFGLRAAGLKLPFFLNPEVNFRIAVTAILLLVAVGILAGLAPALRAARITPTEAMRAQ